MNERVSPWIFVAVLAFIVTTIMTGGYLTIVKFPGFVKDRLHTSYTDIGLVLTFGTLLYTVSQLPMGRLSDRFGRKPFISIRFFTTSLIMFLSILYLNSIYSLALFQIPLGITGAMGIIALQAWILDMAEGTKNKNIYVSLIPLAGTVGSVAGMPIAGFLYDKYDTYMKLSFVQSIKNIDGFGRFMDNGSNVFFFFTFLLVFIFFIITLFLPESVEKEMKERKMRSLKEVFEDKNLLALGIVGFIGSMILQIFLISIFPYFNEVYNMSMFKLTSLIFVTGILIAISMVGTGALIGKIKHKKMVLIVILLIFTFGTYSMPFGGDIRILYASLPLIAVLGGMAATIIYIYINEIAPKGEKGTEVGGFYMMLSAGGLVGPAVGGALWDMGKNYMLLNSPITLIAIISGTLLLIATLILYRFLGDI